MKLRMTLTQCGHLNRWCENLKKHTHKRNVEFMCSNMKCIHIRKLKVILQICAMKNDRAPTLRIMRICVHLFCHTTTVNLHR